MLAAVLGSKGNTGIGRLEDLLVGRLENMAARSLLLAFGL